MTICVDAPSTVPSRTCISWNSAKPRMSAAISSPMGKPSWSWRISARACSRVVRCERIASPRGRPKNSQPAAATAEQLRGIGRPAGTGDAHSEIEHEQLIEQCICDGHDRASPAA